MYVVIGLLFDMSMLSEIEKTSAEVEGRVTASALLRYARVSMKRALVVANLVRGKSVKSAWGLLSGYYSKASYYIRKVLRSAVGNVLNKYGTHNESLVISGITVNRGPVLRRGMSKNKGRRGPIRRPMVHLFVLLSNCQNQE